MRSSQEQQAVPAHNQSSVNSTPGTSLERPEEPFLIRGLAHSRSVWVSCDYA